jgi:hypothetical protein
MEVATAKVRAALIATGWLLTAPLRRLDRGAGERVPLWKAA